MSEVSNTNPKIIPRKQLYWICQVVGWTLYAALILILNKISGYDYPLNIKMVLNSLTTIVLGISTTHVFRVLIIKFDWLRFRIIDLIPRILGTSFLFTVFYIVVHRFVSDVIIDQIDLVFDTQELLGSLIGVWLIIMFWTLLYFLFLFIQNYRKEEIKNLRWQAMKNEIELNKLKSQLNPHFIFNSMNIIRALIVEDPEVAKASITRLSNILRSSMLMGRKRVIAFSEELQLVYDYLNLEKTRFEERLNLDFQIDEACLNHYVPPMILQTLVENGIKHGVSKLPEGGTVQVIAKRSKDDLIIEIKNSGTFKQEKEGEIGFGLINTKQRLQLLYGRRAKFSIQNQNGNEVLSILKIPSETNRIKIEDESISN